MPDNASPLKLVVFDWAGTTVDHGCFAPVAPFIEVFRAAGIELTVEEARGPMGLHKRDHIAALFQLPRVAEWWQSRHGHRPDEADIDRLFADFIPRQLAVVKANSQLIPGLLEAAAELRRRGAKLGGTTGYFREAAELCQEAAREQGYAPDANLCTEDVPQGRPAPWMIFRLMEQLNVYPPTAVVKIGDTEPDMGEGRNAGVWTVGVAASGSDVGLTVAELAALAPNERAARIEAAKKKLFAAGAHYVIDTVADLPALLPTLEDRARSRG